MIVRSWISLVMCVTQSADCYCIHLWKALNISSCCKAYSVNNTIILAPGSSILDPFVFLEILLNFVYFAATITLPILLTRPLSERYRLSVHLMPSTVPPWKSLKYFGSTIYVTSGKVSHIHLLSRWFPSSCTDNVSNESSERLSWHSIMCEIFLGFHSNVSPKTQDKVQDGRPQFSPTGEGYPRRLVPGVTYKRVIPEDEQMNDARVYRIEPE